MVHNVTELLLGHLTSIPSSRSHDKDCDCAGRALMCNTHKLEKGFAGGALKKWVSIVKEFMDDLSKIAVSVYDQDVDFYKSRGVKVHSLEVTRYQCADEKTSEVLQQIIQETTNRMNRLSQAESENEVNLFKTQGEIEQERLKGELMEIRNAQKQSDAKAEGAAEAEKLTSFMDGLTGSVPKLDERMQMWQTLRKHDALCAVSEGGAKLFYTPNDVDLSIKS